jgi:hypothetical protein
LLIFFVINPLVDLKIVEQVVNATEIGTLTGIIIGTAMEVPTIPNSEIVVKNSVPRQAFDNHVFLFKIISGFPFPRLNIYTGSLYG